MLYGTVLYSICMFYVQTVLLCSIRLLRGAPAGTGRKLLYEYDRTNENIIAPNSLLALAKRVPMIGLATSKSQMAPPGPRTREKRAPSRDHREIHCEIMTRSLRGHSRELEPGMCWKRQRSPW